MIEPPIRPRSAERGFFGHPRALSTLFLTEMWERFSYYGMRAILAVYLYTEASQGGLGLPIPTSISLVAAYGSAVFLAGVIGGWAADRLYGSHRLIITGGSLIMAGHLGMTLPAGLASLLPSLMAIVIGTGLLKPNISAMVGDLYADGDTRRDAGYSLFYLSINLGGFLGQLITALAAENVGFHYGFGAAAVGMAFGLAQYVRGRRRLPEEVDRPASPLADPERARFLRRAGLPAAILVLAICGILGAAGAVDLGGLIGVITFIAGTAPVVYFTVMLTSKKVTAVERDRLLAYIPLFLATVLFFLLNEQQATTLLVAADKQTNTEVFGFDFPASWFQSINPLAVVLLAPVFALLWLRLDSRQPTTAAKFATGLGFLAAGYLWVVLAGQFADENGKLNPFAFALVFVILTVGELLISPVGLSLTTQIAPKAFTTQAMGLYLLAPAMGQGLGAQLVRLYTPEHQNLYFAFVGLGTVGAALLLALGRQAITRRLHGVR